MLIDIFQRNIIFRISGTSSKNFIKISLQRFFKNELATKYTWTGFRQHNHLRGLQIIEIIKGSYKLVNLSLFVTK